MVAGIRTPQHLDSMKSCMPEAYKELVENCEILEKHYKDMMVMFYIIRMLLLIMLFANFLKLFSVLISK